MFFMCGGTEMIKKIRFFKVFAQNRYENFGGTEIKPETDIYNAEIGFAFRLTS